MLLCLLCSLLPLAWALPTQNGLNYGADWEPDRPAYDSSAPIYPVDYTDSEQQQQRSAGSQLGQDLADATSNGTTPFVVSPGTYRLTESLKISGTKDFFFSAPGVELICEADGSHFRLLNNTNLTIQGEQSQPIIMDSFPLGFTQGVITASSNSSTTIEFRVMDGYSTPASGGRIQVFDTTGVMQPHPQDAPQTITDLGGGVYRLAMNSFTFDATQPPRAALTADPGYNKFQNGNLLALELPGRGGLELRSNTGVRVQDVLMPCSALAWALPELGDDVYNRFQGIRRPDTNRLVGGGWPLQGFNGGSFTMIDSEISHNFDDITDITSPPSWAFMQTSSRTFYMADYNANPLPVGRELALYSFPDLEPLGTTSIVEWANNTDDTVGAAFNQKAQDVNIRQLGQLRMYTVEDDVNITDLAMVDWGAKPTNMTFVHSYFHDGLAGGIQPKGADTVNIINCVVERVNLLGIAVGFDPFWWEGTPATNICIMNNTVIDSPFCSVNDPQPAISVYAGGFNLNASSPIQNNVTISGNLVLGGMGPGISCTQCINATITDNLIVQAEGHAGGVGAMTIDVSSQGMMVANNIFIGLDRATWQIPITSGPVTRTESLNLSNNSVVEPTGTLSNTPWSVFLYDDPAASLNGSDWDLDPSDMWPNGHAGASQEGSSITFNFTGSEVAVRGLRGVQQGLNNFTLDGHTGHSKQLDLSDLYTQDTVLWRSAPLEFGEHSVTVTCTGQPGKYTTSRNGLSVAGFLVMTDPNVIQQCEGFDSGHCLI